MVKNVFLKQNVNHPKKFMKRPEHVKIVVEKTSLLTAIIVLKIAAQNIILKKVLA